VRAIKIRIKSEIVISIEMQSGMAQIMELAMRKALTDHN